jgi:hypothetical protein
MIKAKFVQFISINGSTNLRVLMRCFRNVAGGFSDGYHIGTLPATAATTGGLSSQHCTGR